MRITLGLLALAAFLTPSPAQDGDLTAGITPLRRPSAPGALRGLTIALTRTGDDLVSARAAIYLQRLLGGAGARVAHDRLGAPAGARPLHLAARAHLALQLGFVDGEPAAASLALPKPGSNPAKTSLQTALAQRIEQRLGGCARHQISDAPVVVLGTRFTAASGALAHREPVHGLLQAIIDWWRADHERIVTLHRQVHATAPATARGQAFHRRFWPLARSPQTEAEVAAMLQAYQDSYVVDATQVHLDVQVKRTAKGWALQGSTELPLLAHAVRSLLTSAGVTPLTGELRVLPDAAVGGEPLGIVTARAAQTWSKPGRASGNAMADGPRQSEQTEVLRGEPVRILDRSVTHLLVHAASGYLGWLPAGAVRRCTTKEFATTLGALTTGNGKGQAVARKALEAVGTPYLFGGRGTDGIDCSGLVQTSWDSQGVFLPRDSRMQILAGKLVATARQPAALQPGDLLFFTNSRGRISHVAISLGGSRFVHATPPEVTVGSLDPQDPWYTGTAKRFCLAKRVAR